ncbi:UNVERIFIED_CONTAM: hypothetical protein O8I53_11720 [Campylobacter lari]
MSKKMLKILLSLNTTIPAIAILPSCQKTDIAKTENNDDTMNSMQKDNSTDKTSNHDNTVNQPADTTSTSENNTNITKPSSESSSTNKETTNQPSGTNSTPGSENQSSINKPSSMDSNNQQGSQDSSETESKNSNEEMSQPAVDNSSTSESNSMEENRPNTPNSINPAFINNEAILEFSRRKKREVREQILENIDAKMSDVSSLLKNLLSSDKYSYIYVLKQNLKSGNYLNVDESFQLLDLNNVAATYENFLNTFFESNKQNPQLLK